MKYLRILLSVWSICFVGGCSHFFNNSVSNNSHHLLVAFENDHPSDLIIESDNMFSKVIEGEEGQTIRLGFRLRNISKKPIAVITSPDKIVSVSYFKKKPYSTTQIIGDTVIPVGDRKVYVGMHKTLVLLDGSDCRDLQRSIYGFEYSLILPKSDVSELDVYFEFVIGVFSDDRIKWVTLEKILPVRLKQVNPSKNNS